MFSSKSLIQCEMACTICHAQFNWVAALGPITIETMSLARSRIWFSAKICTWPNVWFVEILNTIPEVYSCWHCWFEQSSHLDFARIPIFFEKFSCLSFIDGVSSLCPPKLQRHHTANGKALQNTLHISQWAFWIIWPKTVIYLYFHILFQRSQWNNLPLSFMWKDPFL